MKDKFTAINLLAHKSPIIVVAKEGSIFSTAKSQLSPSVVLLLGPN